MMHQAFLYRRVVCRNVGDLGGMSAQGMAIAYDSMSIVAARQGPA